MARLGLKLFFLRTRERRISQQLAADAMSMRQASLSNIERGISQPSSEMLISLCRFYDVTPTWLLDTERGLELRYTERWRLRNALVTVGMYVETDKSQAVPLPDGKHLLRLSPSHSFYDEEAATVRRQGVAKNGVSEDLNRLVNERERAELKLERELEKELELHPRKRPSKA